MGGNESFGDVRVGLDGNGIHFNAESFFQHALDEIRQLTYGAGHIHSPLYDKDRAPKQEAHQERGHEQCSTISANGKGEVTELYHLKNSTGKHNTPDAMVYVPPGFDPSKPVRVIIYNHNNPLAL